MDFFGIKDIFHTFFDGLTFRDIIGLVFGSLFLGVGFGGSTLLMLIMGGI